MLFIILSCVIYRQVALQSDLSLRWSQLKSSWHDPLLGVVFLLMFLNWGIEALKMKYLLQPLEKISFLKSLKSVFAGCSITMLTPNRTGEFGGRILFLKPQNRIKAISVNIIGSISQLAVTMILGSISFYYFLFLLKSTANEKSIGFSSNAFWSIAAKSSWLSVLCAAWCSCRMLSSLSFISIK